VDNFEIIKELAAGGFASFLIAILIAGKYRIWVWGYHLDELRRDYEKAIDYERAEKNQWREIALEGRDLVHRSVSMAGKVVGAP
jgi:hypothetical protein